MNASTAYSVQIYLRKHDKVPVSVIKVQVKLDTKSIETDVVTFLGIPFTKEQLLGTVFFVDILPGLPDVLLLVCYAFLGIFIGTGISAIMVILCCVTLVCLYRRRSGKHYRQVANGTHFMSTNEKHEMKVLTRNTNGYRVSNDSTMLKSIPRSCLTDAGSKIEILICKKILAFKKISEYVGNWRTGRRAG